MNRGLLILIIASTCFLGGCAHTRTYQPGEAHNAKRDHASPLYSATPQVVYDACRSALMKYCHREVIEDKANWKLVLYDENLWAGDCMVTIDLETYVPTKQIMVVLDVVPYGGNASWWDRPGSIIDNLLPIIDQEVKARQDSGKTAPAAPTGPPTKPNPQFPPSIKPEDEVYKL